MADLSIILNKTPHTNLREEIFISRFETGKIKIVSFKAPEGLLEAIDDVARAKGMTRSQLIREALKEYLKTALNLVPAPYKRVVLSS
jgi:hypothetical protein